MKRAHFVAMGMVAALTACGEEENNATGGVVLFPEACTATFTDSYAVEDAGRVMFYVAEGDEFMLSGLRGSMNGDGGEATLVYVTSEGPIDGEVSFRAGPPFKSDCTPRNVSQRVGVFQDVTLYANPELSRVACSLKAGELIEGSSFWMSIESSEDLFSGDRSTYSVGFEGLSEACGGVDVAYLTSGSAYLGRVQYGGLLPIGTVLVRESED